MLIRRLINYFYRIEERLQRIENLERELLYANIWNETRNGGAFAWAKEIETLSPSTTAVGYNYLYVMTRILGELSPKCVLDFGLGISSTLISQYFMSNNVCGEHIVIENNEMWKDFYLQNHNMSDCSQIIIKKLMEKEYKGKIVNTYETIENIVRGKKFDVISIDAPTGSDRYSRQDIVEYLPEVLNDDWVIVMDDYDREGEQDTINEIKDVLDDNGIEYSFGVYYGETWCCVLASKSLHYLCSL